MEEKKVIIYTSSDGQTQIDVRLEDETLWLTQQQIAELFQTSRTNVVEHIKHIYEEKELEENSTCQNFRQVRTEGTRQVERELPFYNLDMIISLGYRIKSRIATHFRQWATQRLKEYMIKGFTLDDDRLKKLGGGGYWKELLERIRDIRATEKVFYRQVLEIYATSIDYDPRASVSQEFFKKVQNKIHYAIHGHTAAELIVERADAEKPHAHAEDGKEHRQPLELGSQAALDIVKRSAERMTVGIDLAVFDREDAFGELCRHAEKRRQPHPEHGARSARDAERAVQSAPKLETSPLPPLSLANI